MREQRDAIRILVVDPSEAFLAAVRDWIDGKPGLELIAEIRTGTGAEAAVKRHGPDLILMDVVLPGLDGFELTRRIKALPSPPAIVIMTLHDTLAAAAQAMEAGADGFVAKADLTERLLPAIREVFPKASQGSPRGEPGIPR